MPITLIALELPHLKGLGIDSSHLGALSVAAGALPPVFIVERAIAALREGKPSRWFSPFLFVDTGLNQIVGSGGFKGLARARRVEIGYGVAPQCRGRGFAPAAVQELLAVAFSAAGVDEVVAETAIANLPSRRVVEKLGFLHIGQRATADDGTVDIWLRAR